MILKKFELIKYVGGQPYSVLMGWMLEDMIEDWTRNLKEHLPEIELKIYDVTVIPKRFEP
jgi:hypothetical protein